jgi:integrase
MHKRLWIDRHGDQMEEFTLRSRIKTYTKAHFGVAIWPHLFRDCLLTTIAVEQPEMIKEGSILLGHASFATGEKYYNQTGMMEASRQYTRAILELRTSFINELLARKDA